ncbi:uracil-DNA glycosylase [Acanthopleuribacter pedis]|uniref:Type-4 uracil-DNA glycosylase n=1 Tax=Acanthopleuribacter pedis TaxID=442870 RepID=A0A8J7U2L3_9BACT|nr:uracil-DNA glycosylase [Acanthopleuribacter pedis]MBO1317834.1 uracil-DNA glycosylase [Acanthopleuribacter pedis]
MAVLQDLQEYLKYMEVVGFESLSLDESPFAALLADLQQPAARGAAHAPPPRPIHAAPPPPNPLGERKPAAKAAPAPAPKAAANLMSIMNMVQGPLLEKEDNRAKADAIQGADKVECLRKTYQVFHECQACALGTTRTHFVFGEGNPDADLMFIGEGPGFDEDRTGRPFVGKAGQLLERIIDAMGYRRDTVFIANIVKCRPPNNRKPLPDEVAACAPILEKQIEFVNPKVIVALGATPFSFLKGANMSITRHRGQFFNWRDWMVMPTFHPAYILRNPVAKRDVWEDMKKVMAKLK